MMVKPCFLFKPSRSSGLCCCRFSGLVMDEEPHALGVEFVFVIPYLISFHRKHSAYRFLFYSLDVFIDEYRQTGPVIKHPVIGVERSFSSCFSQSLFPPL